MMAGASDEIARGLADRLRNLLLSLDRQDRLESAQEFIGWLERESDPARLLVDAREMLLRALRVAADPVNFALLRGLDPLEAVELPALLKTSGLERVALSERLNDLVQTGLVSREMVGDHIRSTRLATGLVEWVEDAAGRSAEELATQLATGPERAARRPGD